MGSGEGKLYIMEQQQRFYVTLCVYAFVQLWIVSGKKKNGVFIFFLYYHWNETYRKQQNKKHNITKKRLTGNKNEIKIQLTVAINIKGTSLFWSVIPFTSNIVKYTKYTLLYIRI